MGGRFFRQNDYNSSQCGTQQVEYSQVSQQCWDNSCRPQQIQPQDNEAPWRNYLNQTRANLYATPGMQQEQLHANATALKDSNGNVRDIQYKGGNVATRTCEYDGQGNANRIMATLRSGGMEAWTRQPNGTWQNQRGGVFDGQMSMSKDGVFSFTRNGETTSVHPDGRVVKGKAETDNTGKEKPKTDAPMAPPAEGETRVTSDSPVKESYEQKLEKTFGKANCVEESKGYRDNLFGAAEQKKPVVAVFGRGSDSQSAQVMDAVARAKEQAKDGAHFMYVDLDKVDPASEIGKYAREHIGKDFGTPTTIVFNQKQGEKPYPVVPEKPMHWQKGPLDEAKLNAAVAEAVKIQSTREIKTGRETKPETKPEGEKPKASPDEQIQQKQKEYWEQIKAADAAGDKNKSAELRAKLGFACIGWGAAAEAAGKKDEAEQHFLRGAEYIMSAGTFNPNLYKDQGFIDALKGSKLPGNVANVLAERGAADAKWFYPSKEEQAKNPNAHQDARDRYLNLLKEEMKKAKAVGSYEDYGQPGRKSA
jgi:hypothetical protein